MTTLSQDEKTKRANADAGEYFRRMMDFVGFTREDAQAIQQARLVIEKHIPTIVADFYTHLLRYPPTRAHFLKPDGSVDQDYLQKRMSHLGNFWRRTAGGEYDDEYARYVDYVGLAHTRQGADPNIYIEQRYVIGQVGFMQRAISQALTAELREYDPELETRAVRAWNMLMMVILELLARVYSGESEPGHAGELMRVRPEDMRALAEHTYEQGLGLGPPPPVSEAVVARVDEIPEGERKLVEVGDLSIGVFHHPSGWYAVRNHCLHRGGPVATGELRGETLVCPWHGYEYDLTSGQLLADPSVKLDTYPVTLRGEEIVLRVPQPVQAPVTITLHPEDPAVLPPADPRCEFPAAELPPGKMRLLEVDGQPVTVYNVGWSFYATHDVCTHAGGPLSEGELDGMDIVCPWHGSCFNIATGAVTCPPADQPVRVYTVAVTDGMVRVSRPGD